MKFKKSGQIILEVLISAALFTLASFSVAIILKDSANVLMDGMKKQKAIYSAKEGLEAVMAIAQDNFGELKNGSYNLKVSNKKWELSKENQKENGFLRKINIEDQKNFEAIKKAKVRVEWEKSQFESKNYLTLSELFTSPKISALELNASSYLVGNLNSWQASAYSIIFWVKPKTLSQAEGAGLFASQDASQATATSSLLQIEFDGGLNYQLKIGGDTFLIGPAVDKWTQLAITWNGNSLKTYYNGKEKTSKILPSDKGLKEFKNCLLGISSDKTKGFEGIYKNLMIFEKALSQEEIFSLLSGKVSSFEGLRLYWKINEGEGDEIKDSGPFNISGNIAGQPLWRKILTFSSLKEVADF